ncbi:uncharacterized protein [Procambarus clarkii]|uniref:uncharacterized protein n=1 Tax=Procambarus clarkii TaxID=6728 RepID=UPI0037425616
MRMVEEEEVGVEGGGGGEAAAAVGRHGVSPHLSRSQSQRVHHTYSLNVPTARPQTQRAHHGHYTEQQREDGVHNKETNEKWGKCLGIIYLLLLQDVHARLLWYTYVHQNVLVYHLDP